MTSTGIGNSLVGARQPSARQAFIPNTPCRPSVPTAGPVRAVRLPNTPTMANRGPPPGAPNGRYRGTGIYGLGPCATAAFEVIDIDSTVYHMPFVGCPPSFETCCPVTPAPFMADGSSLPETITQCPASYTTVSSQCCPSNYEPWTTPTPLETPMLCFSSVSAMTAPSITTAAADTNMPTVEVTDKVFARAWPLPEEQKETAFPLSYAVGIVAAVVVILVVLVAVVMVVIGYRKSSKASRASALALKECQELVMRTGWKNDPADNKMERGENFNEGPSEVLGDESYNKRFSEMPGSPTWDKNLSEMPGCDVKRGLTQRSTYPASWPTSPTGLAELYGSPCATELPDTQKPFELSATREPVELPATREPAELSATREPVELPTAPAATPAAMSPSSESSYFSSPVGRTSLARQSFESPTTSTTSTTPTARSPNRESYCPRSPQSPESPMTPTHDAGWLAPSRGATPEEWSPNTPFSTTDEVGQFVYPECGSSSASTPKPRQNPTHETGVLATSRARTPEPSLPNTPVSPDDTALSVIHGARTPCLSPPSTPRPPGSPENEFGFNFVPLVQPAGWLYHSGARTPGTSPPRTPFGSTRRIRQLPSGYLQRIVTNMDVRSGSAPNTPTETNLPRSPRRLSLGQDPSTAPSTSPRASLGTPPGDSLREPEKGVSTEPEVLYKGPD
ncbi:hypothetical protein QBC47DRAFT_200451 [Echria macrotheca]|uniref:Uncharacterized protein n=1 Tax=Echria macrotheca TaxID=438768 RepID=A0AAJ0BES6_9PEZI|nr:hypothetical protein QBC47DRAFT_200451 [Echria macrotheca]